MAEKIAEQFGQVIRRRREAAGLTQEDLGHSANLSRNFVGMLERGERAPTIITLRQLAAALGTTMSSLILDLEAALTAEEKAKGSG